MKANNATQDAEKSVTTDFTENSDISKLQQIADEYRRNKAVETARITAEKEEIRQEEIERYKITESTKSDSIEVEVNRQLTHRRAVEYAACYLIEYGISTRDYDVKGVDLILDNGKTISVRGSSKETRQPLMNGTLDDLKADYIMIVTDLKYRCIRKSYIMTLYDAKLIARNNPYRKDGRNSWFMNATDYHQYRDNYEIMV